MFKVIKICQTVFQSAIPSTVYEFQLFCNLPSIWYYQFYFNSSSKWYLIVLLFCISLINSNVEHLFMWHLYIFFDSLQIFYLYFYKVVFLLQDFESSLCTLATSLWLDICSANIVFESVICLFIFLIVSFKEKFLIVIKPNLLFFKMILAFATYLRNLLLTQGHKGFFCFILELLHFCIVHLSQWYILS